MRRRFFVEQFAGNSAVMEGDTAHHLGRVLRAQQGQLYELSDGQRVCLARIEKVSRDRVDFTLLEEIPAYLPRVEVTLLLSVVKFDAFEWAIEKATELGVSTIIPLAAARSEKALLASAGKRAERWKKILAEASQQSRRLRVPTLENLARPAEVWPGQGAVMKILLSERSEAPPLRQVLTTAFAPSAALGANAVVKTWRRGGASDRSESRIFITAPCPGHTSAGRARFSRVGTRRRRDCCEASARIFFQRSARFPAEASSAFSLRAAASGMIVLTPSSVAFSMAHSKASNFTTDSKSVTSTRGR